MIESTTGGHRPALLIGTLKAAGGIGALSLLAAGWLSGGALEGGKLAMAGHGVPEPAVTGSIVAGARATRLDPCTGEVRR